ncbi:MAG: TetR family transcriptional regulator [Oscillospiraceae bacterium]
MGNPETRGKLLQAAKRLLLQASGLEGVTARQISTEAGTNLAMINYCFKSKDELLKLAVDEIIGEEFSRYTVSNNPELSAKSRLRELLFNVSKAMIKFKNLTKLSIPYLMLYDEITLPQKLLPLIRQHFNGKRTEAECRVIAFQLVYPMQLIFYRAEDFKNYSGVDVTDEKQMEGFLDSQINMLLD